MSQSTDAEVKEWSDLSAACAEAEIAIAGPGVMSGTHDFFQDVVFCAKCAAGLEGYTPEARLCG